MLTSQVVLRERCAPVTVFTRRRQLLFGATASGYIPTIRLCSVCLMLSALARATPIVDDNTVELTNTVGAADTCSEAYNLGELMQQGIAYENAGTPTLVDGDASFACWDGGQDYEFGTANPQRGCVNAGSFSSPGVLAGAATNLCVRNRLTGHLYDVHLNSISSSTLSLNFVEATPVFAFPTLLQFDFESLPLGELEYGELGWLRIEHVGGTFGANVVRVHPTPPGPFPSTRSLLLDTTDQGSYGAEHYFPTAKQGSVEWFMYKTTTNHQCVVEVFENRVNSGTQASIFLEGGRVRTHPPLDIGPHLLNTWQRYRMEWFSDNTFDVYQDGIQILSGHPMPTSMRNGVNTFVFAISTINSPSDQCFIDDLVITTIADYHHDVCADGDGDTVCDIVDNCPGVPNFEQHDLDVDGVGDMCESDLPHGACCDAATGDCVNDILAAACFPPLAWHVEALCADLVPQCQAPDCSEPSFTGQTVFFSDFATGAGPEWSTTSTDVTPAQGNRFLGRFANETVTLNLTALPNHSSVTVSFELFIIQSWDGKDLLNNVGTVIGPDRWQFRVCNDTPMIDTTFANPIPDGGNTNRQSYPDPYPSGDHPGQTGACEVSTLGYSWGPEPKDSVYQITRTVAHGQSTLDLHFTALLVDPNAPVLIDNESWGLDNVRVTIDGNGITCGNGQLEPCEECDDGNTQSGDCCSDACEIEAAGTVCRSAIGMCDVLETCTGASADCPPDSFISGVECRASTSTCDPAEACDGAGAHCPENIVITQCITGDGCCPEGCTDANDNDCPPGVQSGACCDEDTFGSCQEDVAASQCNCKKCVFYKDTPCSQIECLHNPIPTVSAWGLVVLTLLLLIGAKIYFARRRTATAPQ